MLIELWPFFLLLVIFTIILYRYSTATYDYWKERGVPFVKPQPFFGNFLDVFLFKTALPDAVLDIYRAGEGHPVIGYYQVRTPALLIRDPQLIKRVMVTNFDSFHDSAYVVDKNLDPLLAQNPFMLAGDAWRAVRALLVPAFSLGKVVNQFPIMAQESRDMIKYLENEAPKRRPDGLEAKDLFSKFATDVVVRCGFGVYGNSFREEEATLRKVGEDFIDMGIAKGIRMTLYTLIPELPKFLRFRFFDLEGQNFFRLLVKELIRYREKNSIFRNDYLQMLMNIKYMGIKEKGKNTIQVNGVKIDFTNEQIASHALLLFFKGFECAAFILSYALFEIASNPEVQTRLRAEIDDVLMKYSGGLTYEAVEEMHYLDMVLNETLRKYPPFFFMLKLCTRSCQLPLPSGKSLMVEKGTTILIPTEGLHMDPQYFEEPDKFIPERFSKERKADIKPFTFLPFGAGPRHCFGMKFSEAVIKVGLVAIVSHFEIRKTRRTPSKIIKNPFSVMFHVKGGMWLDFVRRK